MIDQHILREVKKRLIDLYSPIEIYLFGSYAWGTPNNESDLDLAVIIENYYKDRHQIMVDGHAALVDIDIPKDILVYSKEEFDLFSNDITRFCYKIKHDGKKIYTTKT